MSCEHTFDDATMAVMSKHDVRELIARARKRERVDPMMPLAQRLAETGHAQRRFDPVKEAVRLGIEPGPDLAGRLVRAMSAEARELVRAAPRLSLPPAIRDRYPAPHSAAPPEPETFIVATPTELHCGEGCKGPLAANTVGFSGQRDGNNDGIAVAAPPNGDDATVWFVVDAPGEGIFVVSAVVRISGSATITTTDGAGGRVRFKLSVKCSASQVDHGSSQLLVFNYDLDTRTYPPDGMSDSFTSYWSDLALTTPPFIIGVERSGGAVPPVVISAGAVISVEATGEGNALSWDFCPGIFVPIVTADFAPNGPVG